jgi:hypothetical protein
MTRTARRRLARWTIALGTVAVTAGAASAAPHELQSLGSLVGAGEVEVFLDAARLRAEGVAVIRIVNRSDRAIAGAVPACQTVFTTEDAGDSPLRPAESGPFIVPARGEVRLVRPFRAVEPGKRAPGSRSYALDADALSEPGCRD